MRACWNRQTGKLEVLVSVRSCGEHIGMDEHIFFYMGETQERCVFCWLDAPVSK